MRRYLRKLLASRQMTWARREVFYGRCAVAVGPPIRMR